MKSKHFCNLSPTCYASLNELVQQKEAITWFRCGCFISCLSIQLCFWFETQALNFDNEKKNDADLGEIARAKFDFDVVGHYSRPEVLSLIVRDHPTQPVTFTSTSEKTDGPHK